MAENLGVRYILEGSVQRAGDRVRIMAQLIDTASGRHLWADRYDRDLQDLLALQDEITLKIVLALEVELPVGVQTRLVVREPHSIVGHESLAIAYIRLGRKEQARSEVAEVLRLFPEFPLEVYRMQAHGRYIDLAVMESDIEALRVAGLK